MATITLQNEIKINLNGELPTVGSVAPNFTLVGNDLAPVSLQDFAGKRVVLNIFPSIDTGVCAASVRRFNQEAANLDNTVVLCVSKDLPFAQGRFCGAEGIENAQTVSAFRGNEFETAYGNLMADGPLAGLLARSVVVINEKGEVVYTELVPEVTQEPNFDTALATIK